MADVSIIVPIYNAEKYLNKCLDSLINQTKKELEFILVNDGSTDSTEEIIKSYKDKRIKYFKNKNQGIGKTRNFGIDKATSEYNDGKKKLLPSGQSIINTSGKLLKLGAKNSDRHPVPTLLDIDDIPQIGE